MRSATLDLPPTPSLPPAYVARAQRGVIGFTVADLERMIDEEDARLDALAAGPVPQASSAPTLLGSTTPPAAATAPPAPPSPAPPKVPKPRVRKPKPGGP